MTAGLAIERDSPHDPARQVELGALGHGLVDRAGEMLAPARRLSLHERRDDHHRHLLPGDVERLPHLGRDRGQVVDAVRPRVVAAVHHRPAERQMHEVGPFPVGPGARIAERRKARRDQGRVGFAQRLELQPEPGKVRPRSRVEQDVGRAGERSERCAVSFVSQIEHDRPLLPVVVPEEERALGIDAVAVERADRAGAVPPGRLDLDHFGAEPGEEQSRVFALLVCDLDDSHAGEHRGIRSRGRPSGPVSASSLSPRHPGPSTRICPPQQGRGRPSARTPSSGAEHIIYSYRQLVGRIPE